MVAEELNVSTIDEDTTRGLAIEVLLATERGEAPVLGDNDLLATRELVLRTTESLQSKMTVCKLCVRICECIQAEPVPILTSVTSANTHDDLTDVDTGDGAVGLTPSTTHTGLQPIGTGARQHLVDAHDVVGVSADTQVETLLAGVLHKVLVGANACGLEGLGAQLLILVGDKVNAEGEVIDVGTLAAQIKDADLGIGDTTVETRLGIRLKSNVSHCRLSTHLCIEARGSTRG